MLVYDGDGNRVSETVGSTTTKFLVDDKNPTGYSQVMDELVNGAVTRTYTYGRQLISENQLIGTTWTPSFYGYDGHGNVRFLANSAGTITDTYTFDAFGNQIASTGTTPNPYLYSGERFDQNIGLYHLRSRYYNPLTGRFETMDPEAGNILNPATLHKYVYTQNNPANAIDPTGRGAFLDYSIRIWILTQITIPAYIQEIGTVKIVGTAGALAGLVSVELCTFMETSESIKSASETTSGTVVKGPSSFCNEQPHPAPGGPGEGGNPGIPGAPGGGGEGSAP